MSARIRLSRPDGLGQREPLRLIGRRIRETRLGCEEGAHAPESLVIIPQREGVVLRHVVGRASHLVKHALHDEVVVCRVASEVPIVDKGAHQGAALPPVVWAFVFRRGPGQNAGDLAVFIAVVMTPQVGGHGASRLLDVV